MVNRIRANLALLIFAMFFTSLITFQRVGAQDDLLPDLFPPTDLMVLQNLSIMDWDVSSQVVPGRKYLRIDFGVANIGAGPLFLRGDSILNPDSTWNAIQRIFRTDSTWWERLVGVFEITPSHGHAHFRDWAAYRLREYLPGDSVGAILASAEKVSFCIGDFFQYDLTLPGFNNTLTFFNCDPNGQGLSIGWMDIYSKATPGQSFDITEIPNGVYWLEGEADPEDRILESNEDNNHSAS